VLNAHPRNPPGCKELNRMDSVQNKTSLQTPSQLRCALPPPNEVQDVFMHLLGVREAQEVHASLHRHKFSLRRVGKQLNLFLRIRDAEHYILSAL